MKIPALAVFLAVLCSGVSSQAQPGQWKEATVANITADSVEGPFVVVPMGSGVIGGPITHHRLFYHIDTADVTYVLAWVNKKHPLNVTLHGKTKIALHSNGRDAYILDDAGKEVKLPIRQKIARFREPVPQHIQQPILRVPEYGHELLEWCRVVAEFDAQSERGVDDADVVRFGWCAGYLAAIREATVVSNLSMKRATSMGVKVTDPIPSAKEWIGAAAGIEPRPQKTGQELAVPLSMICIPDGGGSPGQLARVVVKWLRDHTERLHELKIILTIDALTEAFPCPAPASKANSQ